jgi:hypothetical protein
MATAATVAIAGLTCHPNHAAGRGGVLSHPEVASARYVEELPAELRKAVVRWQSACGSPLAARHSFAHYLDDRISHYRFIALHFHALACDRREVLCTARGCLHQIYASSGGPYRLVFSGNVADVTLRLFDHTAALEIDCGPPDQQCSRVLRWDGRRFAK